MAKELPYFRFTSQEWQNGKISLESYELKGMFVDICSYYWVNDCSITLLMLEKKFKHDTKLIKELIELEIFSHKKNTDFIKIKFLDEQFDMLSEQRKRRQEAGAKGGKKSVSKKQAMLKPNSSYKDKDKDKDKELDFSYFYDLYHKVTNKPKTDKSTCTKNWNKLTIDEKRTAVANITAYSKTQTESQYIKKCYKYLGEKIFNDEFESVKPKNNLLDDLRELNNTQEAKDYTRYINAIGLSIKEGELNHYLSMKQDATLQQMKDVCIAAYNSSSSELAVLNALKRENKPEITNFKIALLNIIKYYKN